jgi:hypothetical protein
LAIFAAIRRASSVLIADKKPSATTLDGPWLWKTQGGYNSVSTDALL